MFSLLVTFLNELDFNFQINLIKKKNNNDLGRLLSPQQQQRIHY